MKATTSTSEIALGTPIIYYNQWTRFETTAFRGQFRQLTAEEIQQLKKGDVVYIDIDPLHPQGKVYGCIKATIRDIEPTAAGELRIHYRGGSWGGFKTTSKSLCYAIEKAVDETALAKIITENPLSAVIDPRDKV